MRRGREKYYPESRLRILRRRGCAGLSVIDNNNVPIGAVQRILGHENRTGTEICLHSIGQAELSAIEILRARSDGWATAAIKCSMSGQPKIGSFWTCAALGQTARSSHFSTMSLCPPPKDGVLKST